MPAITRDERTNRSELKTQPQLQLTRNANDAGDGAHLCIADVLVRQTKLRMIQDVECFGAELESNLFMYDEVLEERRVPVGTTRPEQNVAAGVAVRKWRGCGECARIKPALQSFRVIHRSNDVRTAASAIRGGCLEHR